MSLKFTKVVGGKRMNCGDKMYSFRYMVNKIAPIGPVQFFKKALINWVCTIKVATMASQKVCLNIPVKKPEVFFLDFVDLFTCHLFVVCD